MGGGATRGQLLCLCIENICLHRIRKRGKICKKEGTFLSLTEKKRDTIQCCKCWHRILTACLLFDDKL